MIPPMNQTPSFSSVPTPSIEGNLSIAEQIIILIRNFSDGTTSIEEATTKAEQLLIELEPSSIDQEASMRITEIRSALGSLLSLQIEGIQQKVIKSLENLLAVEILAFNMGNEQVQPLVELEEKLSLVIESHLTCQGSRELLLSFLSVYEDLLENLWFFPYLSQDRNRYATIINEATPAIIKHSQRWIELLSKQETLDKALKSSVFRIQQACQRLEVKMPQQVSGGINKLKIILDISKTKLKKFHDLSLVILNSLGDIFRVIGDYSRAAFYYQKGLETIEKDQRAHSLSGGLKRLKGVIFSYLGFTYYRLRKYQKAIECHEKHLEVVLDLKDKKGEGKAYGSLGNAYYKLGKYQKAIEFYEKLLAITLDLKDKKGEGKAYGSLGNAYYKLGKYQKAIEFYEKLLAITLDLKDREEEKKTYGNLGEAYHKLGRHKKAIEFHEKHLAITLDLKDQAGEGKAYISLCLAHQRLGEYREAFEYHEKALAVALNLKDRAGEGKAYNNLGNIYYSLGKYEKAIECHGKALAISLDLKDRAGEGKAYGNLGNVYDNLGNYQKAVEFHEKHLAIVLDVEDQYGEGAAYGNLGNVYYNLGKYEKAIEYHEKSLAVALDLEDKREEAKSYGNLGNAYHKLGKYQKAIECHEKHLAIVLDLEDQHEEGVACGNLGNVYYNLGKYEKAVEYHEKNLAVALALNNRQEEGIAYNNLGGVYDRCREHQKAIEFYEKSLTITIEIKDSVGQGNSYYNLGRAYQMLGSLSEAEEQLHQSIECFSNLRKNLGEQDEWKITIFEEQVGPYLKLEHLFIEQGELDKALQVTDARRSRALIQSLSRKCPLQFREALLDQDLTIQQMKQIAHRHNTTFIVYSLSPLVTQEKNLIVWIIPPKGEIQHEFLPLESSLEIEGFFKGMVDMKDSFKEFPFSREGRGKDSKSFTSKENPILQEINRIIYRNGEFDSDSEDEEAYTEKKIETSLKKAQKKSEFDSDSEINISITETSKKTSQFDEKNPEEQEILLKNARIALKKKLKAWYQALISPIEKHLPKSDSTQAITIIPDGFLSQIPFAILCYEDEQEQEKKDKYLIENYSISIAPSIKTLDLLSKIPKQFLEKPLIVGNPDTGNPKDDLPFAELEAKELKNVFGIDSNQVFTRKEASVSRVKQEMEKAQWIFLTCHGQAGKKPEDDPHSVFEGRFKLAPDEKHPKGFLHSEEISKIKLSAELVVLSACFSGTGKVMQEGSIGHVWSFLAAGAQSVLATYWPLQDSALTVEMVKRLTQSILGHQGEKLNKAQALRKVMVDAIKKDREKSIEKKVEHIDKPDQWGAFYLSGLNN